MLVKDFLLGLMPRYAIDRIWAKKSYSQFGEDLIIANVLHNMKLKPAYLDIGANHPISLSNTYGLYRKGASGALIEPDPGLAKKLRATRKRDLVVEAGVGIAGSSTQSDFYIMSAAVLNTFSREEAERIDAMGKYRIVKRITVPVLSLDDILSVIDFVPNFVSIDIEGLDFAILGSIDFDRFRPEVICVETLTYDPLVGGEKIKQIKRLMENKGYFVYADTWLNTVFVATDAWQKAHSCV